MRTSGPSIRVCLFLLVLLTAVLAGSSSDQGKEATNQVRILRRIDAPAGPKYVPGEVLVRFKPSASKQAEQYGHQAVGAQVVRSFGVVRGLQLVRLGPGTSVAAAVRAYRQNPDVLYAEPNYIVHALDTPNDPQFPSLWGLQNTGQDGGTVDADIDGPEAWSLTTGSNNVVVAVIDTGIDYNHPDLAANMFKNTADCNTNGVDDDGNGYVDDCYGIDAFNPFTLDSDPFDDVGHGTHVAGTIGAVGNNNLGVVGVNWNVRLMPCKFLGPLGGDTAGAIACLDYVKTMKDRGVNIVATNNSWGGGLFSQALLDAIQTHLDRGILFIAAAGNEFSDNDLVPTYPANYFLPNIISVAATTRTDEKATFSNLGRRTVHLGAPGQEVLSTVPADSYVFSSGTSMSTPHVTGVAALLKAQDPNRDWRAIRNLILAGGDSVPALAQTLTGRRLNANGSLTCAGSTLLERLQPSTSVIAGSVGTPVNLMMLHINCAVPNGNLQVTVSPTNEAITLVDDGVAPDQAAGDGVYSGQWTPSALGSFTLSFPNGETVGAQVLQNHSASPTPFSYRAITGTNLDLGDDSVVEVASPFPVPFGGGSFSSLFVSSNGTISFTDPVRDFTNTLIPDPQRPYVTLVAPFWDDLYPVTGMGQNVFVDVLGTAPNRELVVEWRDVRSFFCFSDATATIKFQVVFFENNSNVLFNHSDVTFGGTCEWQDRGGSASVGIQVSPNKGAQWGAIFDGDEEVGDGTALLWQPQADPPPSNPVPQITSLSPSSALLGSQGVVLTVNGSGFVPTSQVNWGFFGARQTTYVSDTQLTAFIPASDLAYPWTNPVNVRVVNPAPGGGTSNDVIFTLSNPAPTISSISPTSAIAGSFSFFLTVNGSGFTPSSRVCWNGVELDTFYSSPNLLSASVLYWQIQNPGTAQITVVNPPLGGGTSNAIPFPINSPLTGLPTAGAANSQTAIEPLYMGPEDKRPPSSNKAVPPLPQQVPRFLGWKRATEQGKDFLQNFQRPRARSAIPLRNPAAEGGSVKSSQAQVDASSVLPVELKLRESLPAGFLPTSVAAGDFNSDGKPDFVVTNGGDNNLWLYLGQGNGSFELPRILTIGGQSPLWVAAADLRGNGTLDLVLAEADSGTVGVLLGNGNGTFAPEKRYFLPAAPLFVLAGDFNGDAVTDIAIGLAGPPQYGPVAVLPGTGSGQFGAPIFAPLGFSSLATLWMEAGDMDGDGDLDLVLADVGTLFTAGAWSYLNNGDGTFKPIQQVLGPSGLGDTPVAARLGDMNEDGCLDLIVPNILSVLIFKGECDGTFEPVPASKGYGPGDAIFGIALTDVNDDGHLDVLGSGVVLGVHPIFGQEAGDLLSVMLGDGHGNLTDPRVYRGDPSAFALAVADFNLDGHPDVVTANQDSDSAILFLNNGQGRFGAPEGIYVGYATDGSGGVLNAPISPIVSNDVDGDGFRDLTLVETGRFHPLPDPATVLPGDGTGQFSQVIRSPAVEGSLLDYGTFVLGDFRNTGRPDFIGIGQLINTGSHLFYAPNLGAGTFGHPTQMQFFEDIPALATGDFNKDGKLDFVSVGTDYIQPEPFVLRLFLGNGAGGFTQSFTTRFGGVDINGVIRRVYVGDFNHDTRLDVMVQLNTDPYNQLLLFTGNGFGGLNALQLVLSQLQGIAVVDVNSDGFPDLIEERPSSSVPPVAEYAIYIGQANGTFQLTLTYAPYAGQPVAGWSLGRVLAGDFNGDNTVDIASVQLTLGTPQRSYVQFLLGNGDGSFVPTFNLYEFHKRFCPQFALDTNAGSGAELVELNGFPASFNVIPFGPAPGLLLRLVADPVIGTVGHARVSLSKTSAANTTVQLSASGPAISLPGSVQVAAGAVSQDFEFTLGPGFDASRVFFLEAHLGPDTARAYGTQAPAGTAVGFFVNLDPPVAVIEQGTTSGTFVVFVSSVGGYETTATLSCLGLPVEAACTFGLPEVTIPVGGYVGTNFTVSTTGNTPPGPYTLTVQATDGVVSDAKEVQLKILPRPHINAGGVVNAASYAPGTSVAPGSILAVFGTNLALSPATATAIPLPTVLNDMSFMIPSLGSAWPIFYTSPLQANIQAPWWIGSQGQTTLVASAAPFIDSEPVPLSPVMFSPGLFAINQQGSGQGAILIANTATFAAPTGSIPGATSRPAVRGVDFLEIYCTGLGPVTNEPATGAAASANPLSVTTTTPTVTIGGVSAPVLFSGLAPGYVGLNVVTLQVPAGAPVGNAVPVVLTIGGVTSNTVNIAIQ